MASPASSNSNDHLLLLFDRPQEPCFMAKGNKGKSSVFKLPKEYLPDKFKPIEEAQLQSLASRFGDADGVEEIPVRKIAIPPMGDIVKLRRDANFSLFMKKHRELAGRLIDIFMGMRNTDDLLSVALYARDRVNPYLFNYAYSVALLHRPDTRDRDLPSFIQCFPDKYIDPKVFATAREDANVLTEGTRTPIIVPKDYTASDLEPEHRLAYFREDLGLNLHHWHWHLVYPFEGSRAVVDKNRRGELFYYMHQQIVARYNFERFSNGMKRVERFTDWTAPIPEAYFPKLDSAVSSRTWPPRVANQRLSDLRRTADDIVEDLDSLGRWKDEIFRAINSGEVIDSVSRKAIPLDEASGIDILGNIIESSSLSPNKNLYGDLHNMGHVFISYIHDPDHRHLESFGVIGDNATAMRDPMFYRWHAFIDDMFQKYKATLPRYTEAQVNYPGVSISKVEVQSRGGGPVNHFNTFWQQSDLDLSRGMDFQPRGTVFARFTHLQHQAFRYTVNVQNAGGPRMGTCRIFLAPKHDEAGHNWKFNEQRLMFIELDKFTVSLKQGENTIVREHHQSSVTIPFDRSFRDLQLNRPKKGDSLAQFNFCGCGWPDHMLIPKGTPTGMPCQLFVMISNYDGDRINQSIEGACNDAGSYCGIKDKLYPDRRSMGYPFDRLARDGVKTLQQFLTSNMMVQEVSVKFYERTLKPKEQ